MQPADPKVRLEALLSKPESEWSAQDHADAAEYSREMAEIAARQAAEAEKESAG